VVRDREREMLPEREAEMVVKREIAVKRERHIVPKRQPGRRVARSRERKTTLERDVTLGESLRGASLRGSIPGDHGGLRTGGAMTRRTCS